MSILLARPAQAALLQRLQLAALPLHAVLLGTALALAVAVRLAHALPAGFPLNDGGLFLVMTEEVKGAFPMPAETAYNDSGLPFAYPPLAFWLTALLDALGPWSALDLLRFLPLTFSVLTVPALYLLARRLTGSQTTAALAALLFAVLPRAFNWEVAGGGLTRSLGFLLALLTIAQAVSYLQERRRADLAGVAALWGLTVLAHPQMGWFVAYSAALLWICHGRELRPALMLSLAGAAALVIASPWWLTVLLHHGADPLLSAAQTGGNSWYSFLAERVLRLEFTEEPYAPVTAMLGLAGAVYAVARRQWFLPLWLLAVFVLDPRKASTLACVPVAILAARLLSEAVAPWLLRRDNGRALAAGVVVAVAAYGTWSAVETSSLASSPLRSLQPGSRTAMSWAATHTPDDASFVILRGPNSPWIDEVSEWFPALTGRRSVATVQGYEWAGKEAFDGRLQLYEDAQACANRAAGCLERVARRHDAGFSHVYLMKWERRGEQEARTCCGGLRRSLLSSEDYRLVYDGPGAMVFERIPAEVAR